MRSAIFTAIPPFMRAAISAGVGFFITMIGLKIGQIEQVSVAGWGVPNPDGSMYFAAVTNGIASFNSNGVARMSILGLVFMVVTSTLRVPGAVIISIILTTFCVSALPRAARRHAPLPPHTHTHTTPPLTRLPHPPHNRASTMGSASPLSVTPPWRDRP